jgi:large subunit ribosomal protein L15
MLNKLTPAKGSTKNRKRIGRGQGSGHGGTSTKGHNGQKARSGASIPSWFEGGQMPLQRRLPKFGFKNPFRVAYQAVNLDRIAAAVEAGKLDATAVTVEALIKAGFASKNDKIKILGSGDAVSGLNVSAHAFSASATEKITQAGGSVTTV